MRRLRRRAGLLLLGASLSLHFGGPSTAAERELETGPPPGTADEIETPFRTFYLRKDRTIDVLSEAWAIGGSIYYQSGWLKDAFSVEAEGFTSQRLYGPDDRDGTLLLAQGQEGYSVLGVANAKLRYKGLVLTVYPRPNPGGDKRITWWMRSPSAR